MMFSVSCSRLAASVAAILGPKGEKPITFIINFHSKVFHFTNNVVIFRNNKGFLGCVGLCRFVYYKGFNFK